MLRRGSRIDEVDAWVLNRLKRSDVPQPQKLDQNLKIPNPSSKSGTLINFYFNKIYKLYSF